jgi:manganese transport protein
VKSIFSVAPGILAAIGGFVDIGDIVFNVAAGATFGYQLLWAVVIGVGGIITYAEMCGRVAAVSQRAVFDAVRERLGVNIGLVALAAAQLVNLLTLAAEIGGVALALQLLSGFSYTALLGSALVGLALVLWLMPFSWIERVFGYMGLTLLVFAVAAVKLEPDWGEVAKGFVPSTGTGDLAVYGYFVVGLIGAAMIPYEVYFYSSGAIEEGWRAKDLSLNRANAIVGYSLGGPALVRLDDLCRRAVAAEGNQSRPPRHGRPRRPEPARRGRAGARPGRNPFRGVRGGN